MGKDDEKAGDSEKKDEGDASGNEEGKDGSEEEESSEEEEEAVVGEVKFKDDDEAEAVRGPSISPSSPHFIETGTDRI